MKNALPSYFHTAILVGLTLLLPGIARAGDPLSSLELVKKKCLAFQAKLQANPQIITGTALVPRNWGSATGPKLPIFWWKRPGVDPSFPPLAFIHGGVGSNSWAALDKYKLLLEKYPGDFVAFDHRGEGCSKTISSNLDPSEYGIYRARNVIKDLEYLRQVVFNYKTWRIMGHSRGAALVHYYLEMAPNSLESAHAMGFSFLPENLMLNRTAHRAEGFAKTSEIYLMKYPDDRAKVAKIRNTIKPDTCWNGFDGMKLCGPAVLDVLAGFLARTEFWVDLHQTIEKMTDEAKIYSSLQEVISTDLLGHINYVVGTNNLDFASLDIATLDSISNEEIYLKPFLTEARYIREALAPAALRSRVAAAVDMPNFPKIKRFLQQNPNFKFNLYAGDVDPLSSPSLYEWEVGYLSPNIHFEILENTSHHGWYHPNVINRLLERGPF